MTEIVTVCRNGRWKNSVKKVWMLDLMVLFGLTESRTIWLQPKMHEEGSGEARLIFLKLRSWIKWKTKHLYKLKPSSILQMPAFFLSVKFSHDLWYCEDPRFAILDYLQFSDLPDFGGCRQVVELCLVFRREFWKQCSFLSSKPSISSGKIVFVYKYHFEYQQTSHRPFVFTSITCT